MFTDQSDKNGTTKETKEEDSKKKEKLPKRTDLNTYLNYSIVLNFSSYFFFTSMKLILKTYDKNTSINCYHA